MSRLPGKENREKESNAGVSNFSLTRPPGTPVVLSTVMSLALMVSRQCEWALT